MRILSLTIFLLIGIMFMGCQENTKSKKLWDVDRADLKKEIIFTKETHDEIVEFIAPSSSSRYDFRLYFTVIDESAPVKEYQEIQSQIYAKLHEDFECEVVEKESGKVITTIVKPFNYGYGHPFLLWINGNVNLKKGKEYLIKFHIPGIEEDNEVFKGVYLVVGVMSPVFL